MKVTILGVRGSIPTDGADFLEYGGATSCILVQEGDREIYLDAGSGLLSAPETKDAKVSILLSHTHIDHILGLPLSPLLLSGQSIDLYCKARDGLTAEEQIGRLMSPPLWPVGPELYASALRIHDLTFPLSVGKIKVTGMESNHPGGSTIFRLESEGHSLVYATDYEHSPEKQAELMEFSRGTDLLLYDAQYTEEEYGRMRGFGHSTVKQGLYVFEKCEAKRLLFVHHDPRHSDAFLRRMEQELTDPRTAFARAGMKIELN